MQSLGWVGDLDADAALVAAERLHADLLAAEVAQFCLAAHWVDLHSGEALEQERRRSGRRVLPGMERARRSGADGTPRVGEFAAMELGAVLGMGQVAAGHYVRDAVNVRHRHPRVWAALEQGRGRVWQARRIAQACAGLDLVQARWVDAAVARYLGSLPWGRLEALVEAKIVEADPEAAEERARAAALARFVRTGQSSEYGLKTLVARANAGDVVFFVAMVDRIAQILLEQGDADTADVRRSKAIGILATPARALALLEWGARHATTDDADNADTDSADAGAHEAEGSVADEADEDEAADGDEATSCGGSGAAGEDSGTERGAENHDDPELIGEGDVHPAQNDADDPDPDPVACPTCHGAGQEVGDPTAFTRAKVDPRRLLPNATLFVHLSERALRRGAGVAWMEGIGPITLGQVVEFLGHTNVRVVPVRDLADERAADGYRPPEWMAETLHLRNPACVSPWGSNLSRGKDADHVIPYLPPDAGGPPGQTRLDNLAPLGRFAHRVKTHGRWRLRQPSPGVYEWRTPHGYRFRVDHTGTHTLGKDSGHDTGHDTGHDAGSDDRRESGMPIGRITSMTRIGTGWMETYEAPFTVTVDRNLLHA